MVLGVELLMTQGGTVCGELQIWDSGERSRLEEETGSPGQTACKAMMLESTWGTRLGRERLEGPRPGSPVLTAGEMRSSSSQVRESS